MLILTVYCAVSAAWSGVSELTLSYIGKKLDKRGAAEAKNAVYTNGPSICTAP